MFLTFPRTFFPNLLFYGVSILFYKVSLNLLKSIVPRQFPPSCFDRVTFLSVCVDDSAALALALALALASA